ncbi:MAG: stage II sporulation protein R [Candidatus Galacturonibacter soehngenii]|nr:stage II sporulation protein R [Candidatus Galacturonibacter soehngenii]
MKKKNHIIISLLIVIIGVTLTSQVYISKANVSNTYSNTQKLQSTLAQKIIRFHVIADNDTDESQQLKMKVKNETLKYMKTLLTGTEDLSTTRDILENNLENIKNFALDVVEKEGYEYNVSAEFENCYFPIKEYGSLIFPAGYYDALKIKLGKAEGRNWWCVMYPNLCFVEGSYAVVNDEVKETLEGMLTPDEYHMLLQGNNTKISFKYLKFLNN